MRSVPAILQKRGTQGVEGAVTEGCGGGREGRDAAGTRKMEDGTRVGEVVIGITR